VDVLGVDGSLIVPPSKRLLCRECGKEEPDEIEADFSEFRRGVSLKAKRCFKST